MTEIKIPKLPVPPATWKLDRALARSANQPESAAQGTNAQPLTAHGSCDAVRRRSLQSKYTFGNGRQYSSAKDPQPGGGLDQTELDGVPITNIVAPNLPTGPVASLAVRPCHRLPGNPQRPGSPTAARGQRCHGRCRVPRPVKKYRLQRSELEEHL